MQVVPKCEELTCIHYPGLVKNISNMVDTLGGPSVVSQTLGDEKQKIQLQLRFRPSDRLCKPVNGVRTPSTSFLIKIKVKKKSKKISSYQIIGLVKEEFKFASLCDFQYLAMDKGINIYNEVIPSTLDIDWLKADGPLVLAPGMFSRIDSIQGFYFGKERTVDGVEEAPRVVAPSRRKRYGLGRFLGFEDKVVPIEPKKLPPEASARLYDADAVEILKKVMEERPILSRTAMAGISGISDKMLKNVAPYVAYHFNNGPWRAMWVRFGYDPRTDPSARIYQTLDFRIQRSENENMVELKRPFKVSARPMGHRASKKKQGEEKSSDCYILVPGRLPPSRQFFYQYCDVKLPEVEALLQSVEVRSECHPVDGWLPEGTSFACRRIIKKYVLEAMNDRSTDADADILSDYAHSSDGVDSSESDDTVNSI